MGRWCSGDEGRHDLQTRHCGVNDVLLEALILCLVAQGQVLQQLLCALKLRIHVLHAVPRLPVEVVDTYQLSWE